MKVGIAVGGVCALLVCGLAACGGSSLPRSRANVALCAVLARTLGNRSSVQDLVGMTLMSNAPVSHQLRQDVATYIGSAAGSPPDPGRAQQAAQRAENDCASIDAPVAKAFGG